MRTPGENVEILDRGHGRLQEIEQTGPRISTMLPCRGFMNPCMHTYSRTILGDG